MDIYTFIFSQRLSEILQISYPEIPSLSDQKLNKIPDNEFVRSWMKPGHKRLPESNRLLSEAKKGAKWYHDPVTLEEKQTHEDMPDGWIPGRSPKTHHGGRMGMYNEARYEKISNSLKGRKVWNKGITHSDETKLKLKRASIDRPVFDCPHCAKQIKGQSNLLQHMRANH